MKGEYKVCSLEEAEAFAKKRRKDLREMDTGLFDDVQINNPDRDKAWEAFIKRKDVEGWAVDKEGFPLNGFYDVWCVAWSKGWDKAFDCQTEILKKQTDYIKHLEEGLESSLALNKAQAEKINNMEVWEKKYLDRIEKLENQLDKCSHHEAMAHQGGYELGKASQIKELSDVEISLIAEEFTGADGLDVVDFGRAILKKASEK
jgi:hypothetical protein